MLLRFYRLLQQILVEHLQFTLTHHPRQAPTLSVLGRLLLRRTGMASSCHHPPQVNRHRFHQTYSLKSRRLRFLKTLRSFDRLTDQHLQFTSLNSLHSQRMLLLMKKP